MRASWMLLGILATTANGQGFTFDTVFHADGPVPNGASTPVDYVGQVILQDGNNNVATLGTINGNAAIVHSQPSGGGFNTSLIVEVGNSTYGGGGTFGELQNVAISQSGGSGSRITFVGISGSNYGIFQHDVGAVSPDLRVIVEGDSYDGGVFDLNGAFLGGVAQQVKSDGKVLFAGSSTGPELIISGDGATLTKIADSSLPATDVLSNFATLPAKYAYTAGGESVFIATHEFAPSQTRTDVVSVGSPLAGPSVRFPGGQMVDGKSYTPTMILGATDNDALFRAQATDGSQAIMIARNGVYKILGAYDASDTNLLRPDGIITENRRVATFVPDASGGTVRFYNSQADGPVTTLAAVGTDVTNDAIPWEVKDISIAELFAPMVNNNEIVVFDAKVAPESGPESGDWKDALLAWWPSLSHPVIVAKVGDVVDIGGSPQTISNILSNFINPIFDGGIYKDGLNNQNFLSFGVGYADASKAAVLLTQVPEPSTLALLGTAVVCQSYYRGTRRIRRVD